MTAPERIWLQDGGDFDAASEVTWCQHSIDDADTEYVRADLSAIDVHPDPRDDVIDGLVDAMHTISGDIQINADGEEELSDAARIARAALAAAKAVMK